MKLIGGGLGPHFRLLGGGSPLGPGLAMSAASIVENSAQGTDIATLTPVNASNPGAVSIAAQQVANLFQMNVDGVTLEVGSNTAALDHETNPTATVTLQYTDDNGTWPFTRTIQITDAASIVITTGGELDTALMLVGDVIGDAWIAGTYPDFNGNPVSEAITYFVDGVPVLSTYVLQAGDAVGQAEVVLSATGADDFTYLSGLSGITDYTITPTDLEWEVPPGGGGGGVAPSNTVAPVLSGRAVVGDVLSTTDGTWTGDPTIAFTYQWQRSDDGTTGWASVSGAVAADYTVAPGDVAKYLRCVVTGTNGTGNASAATAASAEIGLNFVDTNGNARLSTTAAPGNAASFTLSCWVRPFNTSNTGTIISLMNGSGQGVRLMTFSNGGQIEPRWIVHDSAGTPAWIDMALTGGMAAGSIYHLYLAVSLSGAGIFDFRINGVTPTFDDVSSPTVGSGTILMSQAADVTWKDVGAQDTWDGRIADLFFQAGAIIPHTSFIDGSGKPKDISGLGAPFLLLGSGMLADARAGDTAEGWNDGFNLGSASMSVVNGNYANA